MTTNAATTAKKKAPAPKKVSSALGVTVTIGADGQPQLKLGVSTSPHQKATGAHLLALLTSTYGHYEVQRYKGLFPLALIASVKDQLTSNLRGAEVDPRISAPLEDAIVNYVEGRQATLEASLARGEIEFYDVPWLFKVGDHVACSESGQLLGGIVDHVNLRSSLFGDYYQISLKIIHAWLGAPVEDTTPVVVGAYKGMKRLRDLPIVPLDEETRTALIARGRKFWQATSEVSYLSHRGQLTRFGWSGARSYRSDGRVMIDATTFKQVDDDQHSYQGRAAGFGADEDNFRFRKQGNTEQEVLTLDEEALWRTYPFVYGFSFSSKQWGRLAVDNLTEINWRTNAFDLLVLDDETKTLVRALVEHQGGSFTDIIEGKGGGTIFLLHGPPGQGKTLTMESIAELLHRPLYLISVGELGTNPDTLEERLREILDVATVWNAVIGLDEADIFLEARDERDIVRNAMVGVFLRLLEYHQGVLFLTTNRVRNIDPAFFSRISIAIHFPSADRTKRQKIWSNLLSAAGVDGLSAEDLSHSEVNARQIKNTIRLSQTLARADGRDELTLKDVERVLDHTSKFEQELRDANVTIS